jgi:hypothetical protein
MAGFELETGDWELKTGNWKLETGTDTNTIHLTNV